MATVLPAKPTTLYTSEPLIKKTLGSFETSIVLYQVSSILALLPVFGEDWKLALIRLALVTTSVFVYYIIVRFFGTITRLRWLIMLVVGVLTLTAVLGTAQVDTSALRLSSLSSRVYNALGFLRNLSLIQKFPHVNQNVLGGLLASFLPLGIAYLGWGQHWWLRLYSGICVLIVVSMLLVTGSRGALIGLSTGLLVLIWFGLAKFPRLRQKAFLLLSLASVPILIYLLIDILPQVDNGTSRLQLWSNTARLIGDYPFTGAGLGQFETQSALHGVADKHAHNLFLQSWAEFGLLGFLAIVLLLLNGLRLLWRYRNLQNMETELRPIMIGALAGLMAMFGNGLVEYGSWGGKFAPVFLVIPALLASCRLNLPPLNALSKPFKVLVKYKLGLAMATIAVGILVLPLLLINVGSILSGASVSGSQTLFETAAMLAPWNATPLSAMGRLALKRGDDTTAQTYYNAAFARDDGDWKTLMIMADFADKAGNHPQALIYLRKAVTASYFINLTYQNLLPGKQDYLNAEKNLKLALELEPNNDDALSLLAGIYESTNRKNEALALIQSQIKRQPSVLLLREASYLVATDQQRIDLLQQAIKLEPQNYVCYTELGNAYRNENQLELTEKAYLQALSLKSDYGWALISLSDLYLSENRPQAAIDKLKPVLDIGFFVERPDGEYVLLARAYLLVADNKAALEASQKAVQYNSSNVTAYLVLGNSWLANGDKVQARQAYQKVLQLEPNNNDARTKLEEIGKNG